MATNLLRSKLELVEEAVSLELRASIVMVRCKVVDLQLDSACIAVAVTQSS